MKDRRDVRSCFVIMPFHEKHDPKRNDRIDFDRVYREIIRPAIEGLAERGLRIDCVRCDEVERAGLIHERMIEHIADADVAVVDITTANPNVYYELGVRHTLRDRVTVLIRRKGTSNPFNIGGMTTIEYDLDARSAARAREGIANFVANGLLSGARDSLVYTVLPGLKAGRDPKPIVESSVEEFRLPGAPGKRIGIVSGDLRDVNLGVALRKRPIDVWVNSENINMQMARLHDPSVSGLIRYLGARRDDTGTVVEDTIANELKAKMGRRQLVNPGEVVTTGPGTLGRTHRVKRIYHAAAVYGVVGAGYHGIAAVEKCITNALARADLEARGWVEHAGPAASDAASGALASGTVLSAAASTAPHSASNPTPVPAGTPAQALPRISMLFPLLASGTARADMLQGARKQIGAAVAYLRSRAAITCVDRVFFLAPNETVRSALRVTLAELGIAADKPASARKVAPAKAATVAKRAPSARATKPPAKASGRA